MTYKENITAILECYFTGFKKEIIDSACNRILEQEPCGDAISRQAVKDWFCTNYCSECETLHDTQTNYCPDCGAKMLASAESEVNNG